MITFFKKRKTTIQLVKEIHEDFFTEVNRLLEEVKISKSLETDKQELINKSERLKKLGFNNTKEIEEAEKELLRLSKIKEENTIKKEIHEAIEYFSNKYPLYKFITEESVKKICEKYNLIYGDVKYFKGNVPEKNLKKIEEFKIDKHDACYFKFTRHWMSSRNDNFEIMDFNNYFRTKKEVDDLSFKISIYTTTDICPLEIAASPSDFNLDKMEIKDFKIEKKEIKIPDPIVLNPVFFKNKKHYLIVTAWGPESSDELVVNERMN